MTHAALIAKYAVKLREEGEPYPQEELTRQEAREFLECFAGAITGCSDSLCLSIEGPDLIVRSFLDLVVQKYPKRQPLTVCALAEFVDGMLEESADSFDDLARKFREWTKEGDRQSHPALRLGPFLGDADEIVPERQSKGADKRKRARKQTVA